MNSAQTKNKKISEYKIEDISLLFSDFLKKISSKIILLEIGTDFLNIGVAKSINNKLYIKKVFRQTIPKDALDKSIPSDPVNFGNFLKEILNLNKINTNRIALSLPSDACYTRMIEIPEEVNEEDSISFVENPNSGIQIPISLDNSDFEIHLTNLPKKESKNKTFNKYFLTSLPKKNVNIILDSIKQANLDICSIQMSHMCIANLLKAEIDKLNEKELLISIDLLDEFTQFIIFDRSGPLSIKRLASIKNYPSIDDMKKINVSNTDKDKNINNESKSKNYHALSKLDVKVLLREINESFDSFLKKNNLNNKAKIFLSGRNSQHKNLVELIGKNLKIDVALISPINNIFLKEFSYNPDEINQFSMSRLIGLGLSLIKENSLVNKSINNEFIIQNFTFQEDRENDLKENKKTNDKIGSKTTSEEKKKELSPLPNLKIKNKMGSKTTGEEKKKELPPLQDLKRIENKNIDEKSVKNKANLDIKKDKQNTNKKSFKMDTSFLKND